MIDKNSAEIELQVGNRRIRICGTEAFVEKKLQEFESLYALKDTGTVSTYNDKEIVSTPVDGCTITDLYSIDPETGKLSIHGKVPGKSKSECMKNVALVVLHGKASEDPIPNATIKEACIAQACLDPKNFATIIKKDSKNFIVNGKGANWSAKLTIFGKQKAQAILEEMLNGQSNN